MQIYTGNEVPTGWAEMLAIFQAAVSNGLFDSAELDSTENPTKIICTKNGHTILDVTKGTGTYWGIIPYLSDGTPASADYHWFATDTPITLIAQCSGGLFFQRPSNLFLAIAKTSAGKTGFVCSNGGGRYYLTCFGDNTSLSLYTNGFDITRNASVAIDRTILTIIPVVGTQGSTDYFSSVWVRNTEQWTGDGVQIIGGKRYGCISVLAILDEDEEETA